MAVKEIKLAEVEFSRLGRTHVTFSRTQDVDWAEPGVFTVYLDVKHSNGDNEVLELAPDSPYVTYDYYINQAGNRSAQPLVTVRVFNVDAGDEGLVIGDNPATEDDVETSYQSGLGVLGDSTETVRVVAILSAATKKYIESDFVGFDKENLTADDLELELKKRDLGELYLSNRESKVRASTDHTLSNLPLDITTPGTEPQDVAASRRRIAEALQRAEREAAAAASELIDNAPVVLTTTNEDGSKNIGETSETSAASRRALAQAIDDATVEVTINIPPREGVDTPGTFKLRLDELYSGDIDVTTNSAFVNSMFVLPNDTDIEVLWLDPGKNEETSGAHTSGNFVPVSVRQLRELLPLVEGDFAVNVTNVPKALVIRGLIDDTKDLYLARDADFNLLVTTSGQFDDLLPLKIYAMTADGVVRISVGTTGNIQAITPGIPGNDEPGRTDRIVWVRNQDRIVQAQGVRASDRDISITGSTLSNSDINGKKYFTGRVGGAQYIWKPAADALSFECFTFDPQVPGSDTTRHAVLDIAIPTTNVNNFRRALFAEELNKLYYQDGANLYEYDVSPSGITRVTDAFGQTNGVLSNIFILRDRNVFYHENYLYAPNASGADIKRLKVSGAGVTNALDTVYDVDLGIDIPGETGTVALLSPNRAQSTAVVGENIIFFSFNSAGNGTITPVYTLNSIANGSGTVNPEYGVDFSAFGATEQLNLLRLVTQYGDDPNSLVLYVDSIDRGGSYPTTANGIALGAFSFGPVSVTDTTYHGVSLGELVENLEALVAAAVAGSIITLTDDEFSDTTIGIDGRSVDSPNIAPSRRATQQGIINALAEFDLDEIVTAASESALPEIKQPGAAADPTGTFVEYTDNVIGIADSEVYVKERVQDGEHNETEVTWTEYSDSTSGGRYIGAFRNDGSVPGIRMARDYWYDYGEHHWKVQLTPTSDDGGTYVLWLEGPEGPDTSNPFDPAGDNVDFPGTWKREVNSEQGANHRVSSNAQMYFFHGRVYISSNYEEYVVADYVYRWRKVSEFDAADVIPYLDGALDGTEWRDNAAILAALADLGLEVAENSIANDQHEESINRLSTGDPNNSGTIKEKLSVDMSNAEASRIRTQHLADEAKYGRGQFALGSTYESGQSIHYQGVLYWATVRIANAQLTPDIDLNRWTTTEDTRVHNALSFDGIPLHADDIIYVDIGPRIDGITDDYFVAGSETTNHNSVGKVYNIPASSNSAFAEVGSFLANPPTTSLKQFEGLCHHLASIDVGGVTTTYEYLFSPYAEYNADGTGSFRVHGMMKDGVNFTTAGIDRGTATPYSSYNPTRQSSVMGIDIISVAADGLSFVVGVISSNSLDGDGFAQVKLFTQTYTIDATDGSMILSGQDNQILDVPPAFITESISSPADNVISIVGVDSLAIDAVYEVKSYNALDGAAIDEYGAIINSIRPIINVHDHTDYVTGFTAEGLSGSLIEFKMSIPQIDTQTGMNRDSGGGIYGFRRSGLAQQVIDNTRAIERIESEEAPPPTEPPPSAWIELTDTAAAIEAEKFVRGNTAGTALEFVDAPSGGGVATTFSPVTVLTEQTTVADSSTITSHELSEDLTRYAGKTLIIQWTNNSSYSRWYTKNIQVDTILDWDTFTGTSLDPEGTTGSTTDHAILISNLTGGATRIGAVCKRANANGHTVLGFSSEDGSTDLAKLSVTVVGAGGGEQGPAGADGSAGAPGLAGTQGDKGDQGIQGIQGIQGFPGTQGTDGTPGAATYVELTDTPNSLIADMIPQVNAAGDGIIWVALPSGGGGGGTVSTDNVTTEGDGSATDPIKVKDGGITRTQILNGEVVVGKIGPLAVGTAQLADTSVTGLKLGSLAVASGNLANNAVTHSKMADASVGTDELQGSAVHTGKINDEAVTPGKIQPSTTDGHVMTTVSGDAAWAAPTGGGGGASTFVALTDTDSALGTTGQVPAVNAARTALEFVDPTGLQGPAGADGMDGASTFVAPGTNGYWMLF